MICGSWVFTALAFILCIQRSSLLSNWLNTLGSSIKFKELRLFAWCLCSDDQLLILLCPTINNFNDSFIFHSRHYIEWLTLTKSVGAEGFWRFDLWLLRCFMGFFFFRFFLSLFFPFLFRFFYFWFFVRFWWINTYNIPLLVSTIGQCPYHYLLVFLIKIFCNI